MNEIFLLGAAAATGGDGLIESTARQFGVTWQLFISQAISFSIVAFLLHRFAYKPIIAVLEERRQRIADSLENADKIKAELARAETERKEILSKANGEANKVIEEARAAAAQLQERETQNAARQAEQIIRQAREAAAAEHTRMLAELRREVGRLVVLTTTKVTGKVLTPEDQQRLAAEAGRQLAA
jgi:F-type H+-transporting ATPase subunit b